VLTDLLQDLGERVKTLGAAWTGYSVMGSFLLYMTGYLALRFHLTTIGIGTDLAVLDERYFFTGARFAVYLVASVPNIVLVALPVVALGWVVSRTLPGTVRDPVRARFTRPHRLLAFGILFSVAMIQFLMRHCFDFSDLLLRRDLPVNPGWLVALLRNDASMPLYFSSLVAGCAVPIAILAALRSADLRGAWAFARGLLIFLAAVQVLLLPINYGVLIVDKTLPRVAALGDTLLAEGDEAWLVWEGKDGVTFLVRRKGADHRSLLTLERASVKRTEIVGFDRIVPTLFGNGQGVN
jgi:hypothetical protein